MSQTARYKIIGVVANLFVLVSATLLIALGVIFWSLVRHGSVLYDSALLDVEEPIRVSAPTFLVSLDIHSTSLPMSLTVRGELQCENTRITYPSSIIPILGTGTQHVLFSRDLPPGLSEGEVCTYRQTLSRIGVWVRSPRELTTEFEVIR